MRRSGVISSKTCPECGHVRRVIRRRVYASQVRWLRTLTYQSTINASRRAPGGDYAKLRFWGLIAKGNKAGFWRLTPRGDSFLRGNEPIVEWKDFASHGNGHFEVIGSSDRVIWIWEVLPEYNGPRRANEIVSGRNLEDES